MVAAGHWRDYSLRIDPDVAEFAAIGGIRNGPRSA
jgi:hypothetical protein